MADELPAGPIPLVQRIPPRPHGLGFLKAFLLTFGYWVASAIPVIAIVIPVAVWEVVTADNGGGSGSKPSAGSMSQMPPSARQVMPVAVAAGYLGGLLYSIVLLRVMIGRGWTHEIGLRRLPLYHLLIAVLVLPGFMVASEIIGGLVQPIDELVKGLTGWDSLDPNEAARALLEGTTWFTAVLVIGIGPGIVEELWCRGFLGRGFIGRYGWYAGIALASLFFGVLHGWPVSHVMVTALMGSGLHFLYVVSRSLWVPMAVHAGNNSVGALLFLNVLPEDHFRNAATAHPAATCMAVVCTLMFCGLAMWHARWRWENERRGMLIPPENSGTPLVGGKVDVIYTIAALGFSASLVGLLLV